MRVNSACKAFFNNRSAAGYRIAIAMLAIFLITSSFTERFDGDLRTKQVNLILRQIGHRLLLQAGDSTSRVLPVTETKEGTVGKFLLRFENEFVFSHDSLLVVSQALLPKAEFPSGYTVTVHDCVTTGIVFGFQVNHTLPDMLPCRGRRQPAGCYIIEFAFPGFYESIEQKTDAGQLTEEPRSSDVDAQNVSAKPGEAKTTPSVADISQRAEEPQSIKVDPQETNPEPGEIKTTSSDYTLINLVYSGLLVLVSVTLLIGRFGKNVIPVPMPHQGPATDKESVSELAVLGKFLFDVKNQRLLSGSEVIGLTDKECRVLELLHKSFGELIPRETLMQKIWINEGVITGRSLDMFVSKLRKKLSRDPDLRITNVHGKGYKLEVPGTQDL